MCGSIGSTPPAALPPASGCGGAAATTQAGGAALPTAPNTSATADAAAGKDAIDHDHGAAGDEHSKHVVQRTKPVDEARARKNLAAVMAEFGNQGREGLEFRKATGTHGKLSDAQKAAFAKKYPDLPVPSAVVFSKRGGAPIGVVYSKKNEIDLGMGNNHQHKVGGTFMQHIWFTPNDMTQAFSDTEDGSARAAYDIVNGVTAGGAPMK